MADVRIVTGISAHAADPIISPVDAAAVGAKADGRTAVGISAHATDIDVSAYAAAVGAMADGRTAVGSSTHATDSISSIYAAAVSAIADRRTFVKSAHATDIPFSCDIGPDKIQIFNACSYNISEQSLIVGGAVDIQIADGMAGTVEVTFERFVFVSYRRPAYLAAVYIDTAYAT